MKLALTEACSNSIRHAYGRAARATSRSVYEMQTGAIAVEVRDAGVGFTSEDQ